MKRLLNLGSGNRPGNKKLGWINIDVDPSHNPDIVRDLDKCLPFDDNSIDQVRASHVIEHVEDVFHFMYEIWRVSKHGELVEIICPRPLAEVSVYPNHKRWIKEKYFTYWTPNQNRTYDYLPVMNASDTKGAMFATIEETYVENDNALRFVLQVIKNGVNQKTKSLKYKILNLGCGPIKYSSKQKDLNVINIDIDPFNKPDITTNLEKGLPFEDNSIDEIISSHFLEHIQPDEINFFMKECWRVLKDKMLFKCVVPIGVSWMSSPYHKAPMSFKTPRFFTQWNDPKQSGYEFKLISNVIRRGVVDGKEVDFSDELHFELQTIKEVKNDRVDK